MSDHEAAGAAITEFNHAIARHADALKRLETFGRAVARAGSTDSPARTWKISTDPDLRRHGGLVCGDRGEPILPDRWPSFEQIATAIKDRDESATDRDAARERLKELGLNPDDWK